MRAALFSILAVCLLVAGMWGFSMYQPTPTLVAHATTTTFVESPDSLRLTTAIQRSVNFLYSQYNEELGLLRESTLVASHRYWLTTDNRLAIYALRAAGEITLPARLESTLHRYGEVRHGVIEALAGQEMAAWPPHVEVTTTVGLGEIGERCPRPENLHEPVICQETRLIGNQYEDWELYSDWLLYGALHAHQQNRKEDALQFYEAALHQFDGTGFDDLAARGGDKDGPIVHYATYKLALALYVGVSLGQPLRTDILEALLQKQAPAGGFYTLYTPDGTRTSDDINTETTAYALLALRSLIPHIIYLPVMIRQ